jgi:translation elongation factor EF-1alpha
MDHPTVGYSQALFQEIEAELGLYLKEIGFKHIVFIPVAGQDGENLTQPSDRMPWSTQTLLEAFEELPRRVHRIEKPLRMTV